MIPVFDLHCDTPHFIKKKKTNHIQTDRLYKQGYTGAVYAHFIIPGARYPFVDAITMLTSTISYVLQRPAVNIVQKASVMKSDRLNIVLGVEGGHTFDNTMKQVEAMYNLGVRVFTITWNNSNKLAHSALDADARGLTKKGKSYMHVLQNHKVILDMSHASTRTVLDVCEYSSNQIIASHSCVRALNPKFKRNIADRAIKAIHEKGGVIGVNFSRYHLGQHSVAEHIDHLVQNFGIDIAAIGSDFDGINDPVIKGPQKLAVIEQQLIERGYKHADIQKIFSKNFLKVFQSL